MHVIPHVENAVPIGQKNTALVPKWIPFVIIATSGVEKMPLKVNFLYPIAASRRLL